MTIVLKMYDLLTKGNSASLGSWKKLRKRQQGQPGLVSIIPRREAKDIANMSGLRRTDSSQLGSTNKC